MLIDIPGGRTAQQPRSLFSVREPQDTTLSLIRARMYSVRRTGPWQVPEMLKIDSRLAVVTLDFRRAHAASQVVDIVIDIYCSALTLVLPVHASVDLTGLHTATSNISNEIRTGSPLGPLHLFLHGTIRFGSLSVCYS